MARKYQQWSEAEENKLIELYRQGLTNSEIMQQLGRNKDSVAHRIALLKQREIIIAKRRTKTTTENYYQDSMRIINNFKKQIPAKLSPENYKLILELDQSNEADGLSPNTRSKYLSYCSQFGTYSNKSFLKVTLTENVEPYLISLQQRLKESSFNCYRSVLKEFFRYLISRYNSPENLLEIFNFLDKKKRKRSNAYEPQEKEHLSRIELVKLVSAIKGNSLDAIRNRAVISSIYDSGGRISEILAVTVKNTKYDDKIPRLFFPLSKTKPRFSHMLKFSLPYLMDWIKVHEFLDNPEAPLFYSLSTSNYGDPLTSSAVGQILRKSLKISGINKKISLHNLRHSKAYHCAEEGMMISEANKLFGWSRTSGMFHYYTTIRGKELELKELERANKLTPEQLESRKKERNAFVMKKCLRCNTETLPDQFVCSNCGLALHKEIAEVELERSKQHDSVEERLKQMQQQMADVLETLKLQALKEVAVQEIKRKQ